MSRLINFSRNLNPDLISLSVRPRYLAPRATGSLECFEVTLPLSVSARHLILPVHVECRLKFHRLSLSFSVSRESRKRKFPPSRDSNLNSTENLAGRMREAKAVTSDTINVEVSFEKVASTAVSLISYVILKYSVILVSEKIRFAVQVKFN